MLSGDKVITFLKSQPRWRLVAAVLVLLAGAALLFRPGGPDREGASFAVRRGPLGISVLEGGSLQSLHSQEIKCEVRVGYQGTKILKIVEEGYQVAEEDVKNGKVLVELDSSELQKQLVQQEIQFQSAAAALADAQQAFDIQLNQNISDVMAADQKARFARMDFEKFLGSALANEIVGRMGLDARLASAGTNGTASGVVFSAPKLLNESNPALDDAVPGKGEQPGGTVVSEQRLLVLSDRESEPDLAQWSPPSGTSTAPPLEELVRPDSIEFARYANIESLGDGEAKQKLRKFQDDSQVAQKELGQAQITLDGTRRLAEKGFVTRTDLQRDEIAYENARLKVQTAETARDLFLKYEFLKTAEETLSKFAEAVRELERGRKAAVAKLAQAEAKLKSAEAQYHLQTRQRKDLAAQVEKCSIRATRPGLVVYGRAGDEMIVYGGEERIREGATVRERQTILTIPDLTEMIVKVRIHESYIKKVKKGQKARITVDAFPDKRLEGVVDKVAVLPDSQNRWMNPDMKVYQTTVTIGGTHDWLKPGMSAKVEIFVDRLNDVLYVPIQAVVPEGGRFVCYVREGLSVDRRDVEVGQFNDEFIEVTRGLKEGELVMLHPPKGAGRGATELEEQEEEEQEKPRSLSKNQRNSPQARCRLRLPAADPRRDSLPPQGSGLFRWPDDDLAHAKPFAA